MPAMSSASRTDSGSTGIAAGATATRWIDRSNASASSSRRGTSDHSLTVSFRNRRPAILKSEAAS